ncbi:hypothetical protein DMN91_012877 [Ooceraea biroi]|uniref:Uncharacterized protein n=1 Tax=Ooceraea biroi TaxID=2015173 RepID=A0A3L8D3L9_OOCBI|nr:hypothetical protein DMN91_012877 [Ooceraea biroi]
MRPSKNESSNPDFNISSFLKTVLPSSDETPDAGGIPGLGLDVSENRVESPQRPNYRHSPALGQLPVTPVISRMGNQGGLNNCQMSHSTPLPVRNLSAESHTPSPYSSQNSQSNVTGPFDGSATANTVNPLPPPPLPPPIFLDDENCYNKLPPKFPTWTPPNEGIKESAKWEEKGKNSMNPTWPGECDDKNKGSWMDGDGDRWDSNNDATWSSGRKNEILSETPESPPVYEKAGFVEPVEYNEPQPQESLNATGDSNPDSMTIENQLSTYRLIKAAADVDHRNLISLTGSPANHNSLGDLSLSSLSNNNNLWPTGDQDYRRHMQPGDIVESVDMEMSDDETDSKPKARVLVDLRSQDRDMRIGPPSSSSHLDMDMPGRFHPNQPNFPQNRPPPNFLPSNQQDFHPNQQEFHQLQQPQDFHQSQQDFEYHDREHNMRPKQDFLTESPGRGRYSQSADHSHPRDGASFHRNERSNRGGNRGFPRNRRDRYSDDHNMKQRNLANSRKPRSQDQQHRQSSPEEGMPIGMPEFDQDNNAPVTELGRDNSTIVRTPRCARAQSIARHAECPRLGAQSAVAATKAAESLARARSRDHDRRAPSSAESDDQPSSTPTNQVTVIPVTADSVSGEQQQNQYVPISEYEEHVESTEHSTGGLAEKPSALDSESAADGGQQGSFAENERLSDPTSPATSGNGLKRSNGDFDEQGREEENPRRSGPLPNGPQMRGVDSTQVGPNGPSGGFRGGPLPRAAVDGQRARADPWQQFLVERAERGGGQFRGGGGGFRGETGSW